MFEDLTSGLPRREPKPLVQAQTETGLLFPELAEPPPPEPEAPPGGAMAGAGQVGEPAAEEPGHLTDWKIALRDDFERWLAGLEEVPEPDLNLSAGAGTDAPDLYSFYEQLAAANLEGRKANRRTAEAISQWGETLARFDNTLTPLRETIATLVAAQPKEGQMSRAHCLVLIELLDRLGRIGKAFESPPLKRGWWGGNDTAWRKPWETQRQAFGIVVSHLTELLKHEGVTRLETLGKPFDPICMTAVAVEPDGQRPAQTVSEELAPGYRRGGELLRAAQVKVTRQP